MVLCTIDHPHKYELENICRLFFPFERVTVSEQACGTPSDGQMLAVTAAKRSGDCEQLYVRFVSGDFEREASDTCAAGDSAERERLLAVMLFKILCEFTGMRPGWGILTGVRPGKLMRRLVDDMGETAAREYFAQKLLCLPEKIELCTEAAVNEQRIIASSKPRDFSLYFAIPFCPTRCSYCSFVSHSVERSMKLMDDYVRLLCDELARTGEIVRSLGLNLSTVYVGGGTPTTLNAEQLKAVMAAVSDNFDMSRVTEYTVEAGRPDTVTADKLDAILQGGATRISINPQTLNDSVLNAIGRRHTTRQTLDAFSLAREQGFGNINMDLIAGLPTDTLSSFINTVEGVLALNPESVTVHTLSMKRSSRLSTGGELPDAEQGILAGQMLSEAAARLKQNYIPYYLYRQSKTVGNHENTGYSKPGFECLYNIFMMDETHTVLACGASGVTKLKRGENTIERIFNYKYPYEYISHYDEIIKRKQGIIDFYGA